MEQRAALHAVIQGMVQAVNFRIFVQRNAKALGLTGYVRNISSEYSGTYRKFRIGS